MQWYDRSNFKLSCYYANRQAENECRHLHKPRVLALPETGASFHYPEDFSPEMGKIHMKPSHITKLEFNESLNQHSPITLGMSITKQCDEGMMSRSTSRVITQYLY